ncbi:MAG TPA: SDR family NAD(P)-dependent oxidoreductase [Terriglobales bacterium]|nr:SDR family NAD(P)-dependent oxidoreductase [Terriglobales bacterium]
MSDQLSGRVAVITGASMGIGEALARLLAAEGATVVLASRDQARLEAARTRIGHPERTLALACDVRNREDIDRVLSLTLHNFGRIDIWVNNAGLGLQDSVEMMDLNACRRMFETNLFGAIDGMQAATPVMKRQGGGTIINISSVAGHIPLPFQAAYSATKFAMNAIGKAARVELLGTGVHVLTVCPGYIATNFRANKIPGRDPRQLDDRRRGASAETVARDILNGYLHGKREVFTPHRYWIAAKVYGLAPQLVEWVLAKKIKNG